MPRTLDAWGAMPRSSEKHLTPFFTSFHDVEPTLDVWDVGRKDTLQFRMRRL